MSPAAPAAPGPRRVAAGLAFIYLVWGSTFPAAKVMVETLPPWTGSACRYLLAGALLLGGLALRGGSRRLRVTRRELASCAAVGLLLMCGAQGVFVMSVREMPAGVLALVAAGVPLWVVLLRRAAGERVPAATLGLVAVGLAGIGLLALPGGPAGATVAAVLVATAGAGAWATGSFAQQRLPGPADPLLGAAVQLAVAAAGAAAIAALSGELAATAPATVAPQAVVALAYLTVAGSVAGLVTYLWLLRHLPISTVATHAYVNPIVAILLGWALLGEALRPVTLAVATVVVASVALTIRAGARERRAGRHADHSVRLRTPPGVPAARAA